MKIFTDESIRIAGGVKSQIENQSDFDTKELSLDFIEDLVMSLIEEKPLDPQRELLLHLTDYGNSIINKHKI